ncbi:MAG TPA: hypothetical protein VGQ76_02985 [Thermoanaerobaculia bacterium]|jgi:hypothetical protein|nr:hypothetical protein [Thermoanaerobaculia bacterium]
MNTAFGLLTLLACGLIALYWGARVTLQFVLYDRSVRVRPLFRVAEALYVSAFAYLAVVYSMVAVLT